jgi:hypothetical protein
MHHWSITATQRYFWERDIGELQRRLTLTKLDVALRARYSELMRLRAFVKRIEDSGGDDVDIKLEKRVSPMLPGTHRVPFVTRRRRPSL